MIKYRLILIFSFFFIIASLYAQDDSIKNINIPYGKLNVNLSYNDNVFFSGVLTVSENGKEAFRSDTFFTRLNEYTMIDLDGDKNNELVLDLSSGASPYVYNYLVILDNKVSSEPLFCVQNGTIDTMKNELPKLNSSIRLSPSVLGVEYFWLLEYKNKKVKYFNAFNTVWEKRVTYDEKDFLSDLKNRNCDYSEMLVYFEGFAVQCKISGHGSIAIDDFDEYYKCKDKKEARKTFMDDTKNFYNYLVKDDHKFSAYFSE